MTTQGYVGNMHQVSDEGAGWTGVTITEKNRAAGRYGGTCPYSGVPIFGWRAAAVNAERAALTHGSGHWTAGGTGSNGG